MFESLPQSMKACFESQDIGLLQTVIKELPEEEARSGLGRAGKIRNVANYFQLKQLIIDTIATNKLYIFEYLHTQRRRGSKYFFLFFYCIIVSKVLAL